MTDLDDDDAPRQPNLPYQPLKLEGWADGELRDYLVHLRAEIARVEETLNAKISMRGDAESLFKK